MQLALIKMPGGMFRPANESDAEIVEKIANNRYVTADIKQVRNPAFHAKFFALLNFGYQYFEPEPQMIREMEAVKNFDRFREDVTILAGHREAVVNIKNEVRFVAKSISFGSMDELEFNELYKTVFEVIWRLVVSKVHGMTEEIAQNTIDQMLGFS